MFSWLFGGIQDPAPTHSPNSGSQSDRHESISDERNIPDGGVSGKLFRYTEDSTQYTLILNDAVINVLDDEENAFSSTFAVYNSKGNLQFSQPLGKGFASYENHWLMV